LSHCVLSAGVRKELKWSTKRGVRKIVSDTRANLRVGAGDADGEKPQLAGAGDSGLPEGEPPATVDQ
jgi:hypothetical protein